MINPSFPCAAAATSKAEAVSQGIPDKTMLLGFDFGERRIGIAIANTVSGARPLLTLPRDKRLWSAIAGLIKEWRPSALVVGLPLTADGQERPMSLRCRRFGRQLQGRFLLPVHHSNEYLTSRCAEDMKRQAIANASEDAIAAALLLADWLHSKERAENKGNAPR